MRSATKSMLLLAVILLTSFGVAQTTITVDGARYPATLAGIRSAITAACNGTVSGKVILPPGTYPGNSPLILPSHCTLLGSGSDQTIISFTPSALADFLVQSSVTSDVEIGNLSFRGNSNAARAIQFIAVTSGSIHDLKISGFTAMPSAGVGTMIYVIRASSDVTIERNVLTGNGPGPNKNSDAITVGIKNDGINRVRVNRNRIEASFSLNAISVHDCTDCEVTENTIDQNNQIGTNRNFGGYGIALYRIGTLERIRIAENRVSNTAGSGIYCVAGEMMSNLTVVQNIITNCCQQEMPVHLPVGGIAWARIVNSLMQNNTISTSGKDGVVVQGPADGDVVANNTVSNTKRFGINLIGQISGSLNVTANTVETAGNVAISQESGSLSNAKIERNIIRSPGFHGILLKQASETSITDNEISGLRPGATGIAVSTESPGANNQIIGNEIGGGTIGITVGSSSSLITKNVTRGLTGASVGIQLRPGARDARIENNFIHDARTEIGLQ
jgi:hypothetical protein